MSQVASAFASRWPGFSVRRITCPGWTSEESRSVARSRIIQPGCQTRVIAFLRIQGDEHLAARRESGSRSHRVVTAIVGRPRRPVKRPATRLIKLSTMVILITAGDDQNP